MVEELSDLMETDGTGALKHPDAVRPLEELYDVLPKQSFTFKWAGVNEDLDVEYVLINSRDRPIGEKAFAFAISKGLNWLFLVYSKIFICEDLIPNKKFFKYLAIHEIVEIRSSHYTAIIEEMRMAEGELNDDELRDYCNLRADIKDYAHYDCLKKELPDKVKRFLEPMS